MSLDTLDYILSPVAVRQSCEKIFRYTQEGKGHFTLNLHRMDELVDLVIETSRSNYPDFKIPFHSRLRHFQVGGIDRLTPLLDGLRDQNPLARCRTLIDLIVVSVLLDAGAGRSWHYYEESQDKTWNRSEGLAVASFDMFQRGLFSLNYQAEVTAAALKKLPLDSLAHGFQVTDQNPLVGLEGRRQLLNNLGKVLEDQQTFFPGGRPGSLVDYILETYGKELAAQDLLKTVLQAFGNIWPGRYQYQGQNLGDAWPHPGLKQAQGELAGYVVFHKLSQWLSYSLVEALELADVTVQNINQLTGLAEYRNGGLFLDGGVISLKDPTLDQVPHDPQGDLIIEWRALTVVLLDQLADLMRRKLHKSPEELPLVAILEGGTWWAGRKLASSARADGSPPLKLNSDGTIF